MALIRFAEGQQRSGSSGGTVFSRNRSGAYIRARSKPVNPNTDAQVVVRNAMRSLTIAWDTILTEALRADWDEFADNLVWKNKLGDDIHLTGLNHYVRANTPRLQNGLARIDVAPTQFNLAPAELSLAIVASVATQDLVVTFDDAAAWCSQDGGFQAFYMGLPKNASIKFFGGPYALAGLLEGNSVTPIASPQTLASLPWSVNLGNRYWVRSRVGLEDARLSEFAQVNFLGVA